MAQTIPAWAPVNETEKWKNFKAVVKDCKLKGSKLRNHFIHVYPYAAYTGSNRLPAELRGKVTEMWTWGMFASLYKKANGTYVLSRYEV